MKAMLKKILDVMIYFFTPEDSEKYSSNGFIAFKVDSNCLNMGAAKAIFWFINAIVLFYLLTLL